MDFIVSAVTDVGICKKINQDRIFAEQAETPYGTLAFAVICDGMGGLEKGEIASSTLVQTFSGWFENFVRELWAPPIADCTIRKQWTAVVEQANARILEYSIGNGCKMGTTATAMLLTKERYYLMNIGDTRAYEVISYGIRQLTVDHTLVQQEVDKGNLTKEQAESAPMNHVLTRCIGVEAEVYPDLFFGDTKKGAIYFLCSDGFRHRITEAEIIGQLCNSNTYPDMENRLEALTALCKQRGETDNISVIAVQCMDD